MCDDDIDKAASQHSMHTSIRLVATGNVFYTRHTSTNPNHFSIIYYFPVDPSCGVVVWCDVMLIVVMFTSCFVSI